LLSFAGKVLHNNGYKKFTAPLVLSGILIAGTLLRVYDLGTESLWLDEGISIFRARLSPSQLFESLSLSTHQPLYYLILHYWINLFGDSAISVRSLSSVFGVLSVFMMYKVAKGICGEKAGLMSALIMGVSVFHVWYSQEARNYSLVTLLSLISMYYFIRLRQKADSRHSIGYVIPSGLLLYTHYFGFFVILAQHCYLLGMRMFFRERNQEFFRRWVIVQAALVVSYLPWFAVLKVQASLWQKGRAMEWITAPRLSSVYESFETYAGSGSLLVLFLILMVFAVFGHEKNRGPGAGSGSHDQILRRNNMEKLLLLGIWLCVPVFVPFVLSFLLKPMYMTRFTIAASPAFYILAARGIQNIPTRFFRALIPLLIIVLSSMNVLEYYGRVDKQQWREVAGYIDKSARTGDVVIFIPGDPERLIFSYYSRRTDIIRRHLTRIPEDDRTSASEHVRVLLDGNDRVWLVVSLRKDPNGIVRDALGELGYVMVNHEKYDGNGALPSWGIVEIFLFGKHQ
jgi:uncharacterized membrane protein